MPALRQAWLIFRPASRSAWKSRRIAAIWSGLGRFRMGRSLALCQLYDSHYGWTRFWGAGQFWHSIGTGSTAGGLSQVVVGGGVWQVCRLLSQVAAEGLE